MEMFDELDSGTLNFEKISYANAVMILKKEGSLTLLILGPLVYQIVHTS
jgi:hypothetical protein